MASLIDSGELHLRAAGLVGSVLGALGLLLVRRVLVGRQRDRGHRH